MDFAGLPDAVAPVLRLGVHRRVPVWGQRVGWGGVGWRLLVVGTVRALPIVGQRVVGRVQSRAGGFGQHMLSSQRWQCRPPQQGPASEAMQLAQHK